MVMNRRWYRSSFEMLEGRRLLAGDTVQVSHNEDSAEYERPTMTRRRIRLTKWNSMCV